MCGIINIVDFKNRINREVLERMIKTLSHRGPNNNQSIVFSSSNYSVGLAHARLSIIDLSEDANQPMTYKHFHIVFNGEIYNYKEIKKELEHLGHHFALNSDTEIILHSFEEWGIQCVERFIGMFVFVIYDNQLEKIYVFRDRSGVKPLYYYAKNGLFIFASELKPFSQHPNFEKEIDKNALALYFNYGYIPAPYSIFKNTLKLEPGKILMLDLHSQKISIKEYWKVDKFYKLPKLNINYQEAKDELHKILKSAFEYRMIADVPVGVFLSGGYDSTAVTAILQRDRTEQLKTFTIGFEEGNNEAPFAKETAAYLGTDHNEFICTTNQAQSIIPNLSYYYDEPFGDSSAIPTILVSQFAKQSVTVALSADGGDEIFAGYNSYMSLCNKERQMNKLPDSIKPLAKQILSFSSAFIPSNKIDLKHKINGLAESLNPNSFKQLADLFRLMSSIPKSYIDSLFLEKPISYSTKYYIDIEHFSNELELPMAVDYQMYLPDDILTKVDRATMSVSLEGREPFLDHRIIEFAAQLPLEYKFTYKTGKRILKDIVHEYIPEKIMKRPKTGFTLPIYSWLRGELSYLLDDYLNERALAKSGIFDVQFVSKQVKLFKEGKLHYTTLIWKMLMFQMWYHKWM